MRREAIRHQFVEFIPATLEEGTFYVSVVYATAAHLCPCGCGTKVVTPLSPVKWRLSYDGDSVSLAPSIGNWQFPCRSHYWIRRNKIKWARAWTDEEINEGRRHDAEDLAWYLADKLADSSVHGSSVPSERRHQSILHRVRRLLNLR